MAKRVSNGERPSVKTMLGDRNPMHEVSHPAWVQVRRSVRRVRVDVSRDSTDESEPP